MSDVDLGTIKIPGWLPGAADLLIAQAEEFLGDSDGKTRKQWVMDTLKTVARAHDIEGIPDWIERPLEDAVISLVIETILLSDLSASPTKKNAPSAKSSEDAYREEKNTGQPQSPATCREG